MVVFVDTASEMSDAKELEFSFKVMVNKEKTKVIFAETDRQFVDILLSFLTLPLGRIIKVLEKHYGDKAPTIGSLSNLYRSLANLDSASFVTEGAKNTLLSPTSSFEAEYEMLKLDISDSPPAEYFVLTASVPNGYYYTGAYYAPCCTTSHSRFRSMSLYYDQVNSYKHSSCGCRMTKKVDEKGSRAASSQEVFTSNRASFIISDDLQILPNVRGFFQVITILGIRDMDMDEAETITTTIGLNEMLSLLKASFVSTTPLSDLILDKTVRTNSVTVGSEPKRFIETEHQANPNAKKMVLKAVVQKSSGKLLYAQVEEDFVEFLFSFFNIPVGGAEHLVAGKTGIKAIDNLYRSTIDLLDDKYFKSPDSKKRLIKPNLLHGCISKEYILPLTEESLPSDYSDPSLFLSAKFPKGQGRYLDGPTTYLVTDDLVVTPFCIVSSLSYLRELKVPISDVKEVELEIGMKEALSILRASFTSTSALTDALHPRNFMKQPKLEREF